MKRLALAAVAVIALAGCTSADTVNHNSKNDADNFKVSRRITFINGITDKYLLSIEGYCATFNETADGKAQLTVTCKVGDDQYKRHMLGLSDNVTYMVEQIEPSTLSDGRYRITYKPEALVPDVRPR